MIDRREERGDRQRPPSDIIKHNHTAAGITNAPQCTLGRIKSSACAKGERVNFAEEVGVERERKRRLCLIVNDTRAVPPCSLSLSLFTSSHISGSHGDRPFLDHRGAWRGLLEVPRQRRDVQPRPDADRMQYLIQVNAKRTAFIEHFSNQRPLKALYTAA